MLAISDTLGTSILVSFDQVGFQSQFNPILMIIAWILGGLLVIPEMLLFSEAATSYPENGTSYYWIKRTKWNACSFWFGWIMVLFVSATAVATACLAFGNIIVSISGLQNEWYAKLFGIIILLLLLLMQLFIKKSTGWSQIVFTILKLLPIGLLFIIVMIYGNTNSFQKDTINQNLGQIYLASFLLLPATAMTMFVYSGMEAITYISGGVIEPQKNVPRVLIWSTIAIIILYVILALGLLTVNKPLIWLSRDGNITNVWYYAIINNPKIPFFCYLFSDLATLIFIGSLNSFLVYHSQLIFKMSEEGDLFQFFQKTTAKTNMPYLTMVLLTVLTIIYILWYSLFQVTNYFILAVSVLKTLTIGVIIYLRYRDSTYQRIYCNPVFIILIFLSLNVCLITFTGAVIAMYYYGKTTKNMWELWNCLITMGIIFAGYPLYYLKKYRHHLIKIWQAKKKNTKIKD